MFNDDGRLFVISYAEFDIVQRSSAAILNRCAMRSLHALPIIFGSGVKDKFGTR